MTLRSDPSEGSFFLLRGEAGVARLLHRVTRVGYGGVKRSVSLSLA